MEALNRSLSDELLKMAETDKAMRMGVIDGEAEWDDSIDKANQTKLMGVVEEYGWPTIPQVGADASHAAWIIVQHAPDLAFMERCL